MTTATKTTKFGKDRFVGQSKARKKVLMHMFEGWPLEDSDADMLIVVVQDDIDGCTPGDPENCIFACSAKRAMGSSRAVFLRAYAYIQVPCTKAEAKKLGYDNKVLRFTIPKAARDQIVALDTGGQVDTGTFRLTAPTRSERLGQPRRASRGPGGHKRPNNRNVDSLTLRGVRNGSGKYHRYARTTTLTRER